jgi:hypothetical protein
MLIPEAYERWGKKIQDLRDGKLFIVVIKADESVNDNAVPDIMRALSLTGCSPRKDGTFVTLEIEREGRPSDAELEKIRAISGVIEVMIRP